MIGQLAGVTISLVSTVVALALLARAVNSIVRVVRLGQVDRTRRDARLVRLRTTAVEVFGHTRMAKWRWVGVAHWFVFVGFGGLLFTLITAYGQLFEASFALPLIGHWAVYEAAMEFIAALTGLGILVLIGIRQARHPRRLGRASRFSGSTNWTAYYVELTIVAIVVCVLLLRGLDGALAHQPSWSWDYPVSYPLVAASRGASASAQREWIYLVATVKIVISMAWFIVIATNLTMGVAWHRFLAFFNIYYKRYPGIRSATALGPLQPMRSGGELIDFTDPDEDALIGVGAVEHFTWKALLDFSTCTECGRCQSQCPAWNTGKPLSPKLLVMDLRSHLYGKAPYLLAEADGTASDSAESNRALVGPAEFDVAGHSTVNGAVIDPDVLWSCTNCGACVEQCPVDIEHVDHIVDMRRYQVMIESSFPTELNGLFRNLEGPGNPWGSPPSGRMDWAKDLGFEVPVIGVDAEDLADYEYLFWVGCAGAFEDRAKRTTQAVATLLNHAGVTFAVLGQGEACTGDPARRAGNEFLFQTLAQGNVETLNEVAARRIVVTCPHCFNTLNREYPQLGGDYDVVHHTQLLNQLVRDKRLIPVLEVSEKITYHDPCFLGRHNQVYAPPRELLEALPGAQLLEPSRTRERSFCCGAGGARMWMEEKLGTRINLDRSQELLDTTAGVVAVGCPFCRVMITDGVNAINASSDSSAEVLDVAQLLLRSIKLA